MNRNYLFAAAATIYAILFSLGRFVLLNRMSEDLIHFLAPLLQDLLIALFIVLIGVLLKKVNLFLAIGVLLLIDIYHIANMEYVYALGNVINLRDIHYVTDKEFLTGTFSHISFPLYSLLLLLETISMIVVCKVDKVNRTKLLTYGLIPLLAISMQFVLTPANSDWKDENLISLSLMNSLKPLVNRGQEIEFADSREISHLLKEVYPDNAIDEGEPLIDLEALGSRKMNVLFVVMEGIPGAYIREVQQFSGFDLDFEMKSFQRIVDHSIIVPNFITHNNQTIRGLYSILSGDYPKLDASTPKAYEYLQLPEESRSPMVPKLLKDNGYFTSYIQAAPLAFMSKDQFMRAAGFDEVLGEESFRDRYLSFGWGVDDKAFLEQSAAMISKINKKDVPWFVTLLTVGTHHPYAVPDELEDQYPNRKMASVAYLDEALGNFMDFLKKEKIDEDTIIFFMSDESHDVNEQMYGSNWGTMLIYHPDFDQVVHPNVFGHVDIFSTIKDLLDPDNKLKSTGRSMFRTYVKERPILFASHYNSNLYFSKEKGVVYQLDRSGSVKQIRSSNGEMFSDRYDVEDYSEAEFKEKLLTFKNAANHSLFKDNDNINQYLIIDEKEYALQQNRTIAITSGQYVSIPANSVVTIKFDYEIGDDVESLLFSLNDNFKKSRKVVDRDHFDSEMVYQFVTEDEITQYSFELSAQSFIGDATAKNSKLKVSNLTLSYSPIENGDVSIENSFYSYDEDWSNLIPFMTANGKSAYPFSDLEIEVLPVKDNAIFVYGPYIALEKGSYTVSYKIEPKKGEWENGQLFKLDVSTDAGGNVVVDKPFDYQSLVKDGEGYLVSVSFEIEEAKQNVEFRMKEKKADLGFIIKEIGLEKLN